MAETPNGYHFIKKFPRKRDFDKVRLYRMFSKPITLKRPSCLEQMILDLLATGIGDKVASREDFELVSNFQVMF